MVLGGGAHVEVRVRRGDRTARQADEPIRLLHERDVVAVRREVMTDLVGQPRDRVLVLATAEQLVRADAARGDDDALRADRWHRGVEEALPPSAAGDVPRDLDGSDVELAER